MVKYEKITLFGDFLVLLGPIISRLFTCLNEEEHKQKQQSVLALVLSLWSNLIETVSRLPPSPTRIVPLFPPMVVFVAMVAATPFPSCKSLKKMIFLSSETKIDENDSKNTRYDPQPWKSLTNVKAGKPY